MGESLCGAGGASSMHCNPRNLRQMIAPQSTETHPMSLTVRRVVTGHDKNGHAIVQIDEIAKNVHQGRPGAHATNIWTTEGFPIDNDGDSDASERKSAPRSTTARCSGW